MSPTATVERHRWRGRALLGACAGLVLVVVLAGPAALAGTSVGQTAFGTTDCASAADQAHVGLIIDFGDQLYAQAPPSTTDQCVAGPGSTGLTLLIKGGHTYRPGTDPSFVCAIDGYPATGCGVHNADGTYDFWSYWRGGSSWTYSGVGANRTLADGQVDGWHFVRGHALASDPPPGPMSTGVCPETTITTPAPTTVDPTAPGGPGLEGRASGGGSAPRPAVHLTPTIPAGTSGQTTTEPGSTSDTIQGEALTASESATTVDGEGFAADGTDRGGSANEMAAGQPGADGGSSSSGGAGVPIAVAGGGVVIAALGVTAALRFRAKPDE